MNEFTEKYKSFENQKLLKILEEAAHYKPAAIEAAKLEIASRQISQSEIDAVKAGLEEEKSRIQARQNKIDRAEGNAKSFGAEFLKTISPIQEEPQTTNRKINLLGIIFALYSVYIVVDEFDFLIYMLTEGLEGDWLIAIYFIPFFLLPLATIFFWRRKKPGWFILDGYLVYLCFNLARELVDIWWWRGNDISESLSGLINLEMIEPYSADPITICTAIAFLAGIIWVMNKPDVRNTFQIDRNAALITAGIAGGFALIGMV